jgi:hypothetical protein
MRRLAVAVAAAVAVLAVGGVAVAQTTGDERIYACVNDGDGAMRQVAGPEVACKKGWHQLSWSSENPQATPALNTYRVGEGLIVPESGPNDTGTIKAFCDEGDLVTSGGFNTVGFPGLEVRSSRIEWTLSEDDLLGWSVTAVNTRDTPAFLSAEVVCLDITP